LRRNVAAARFANVIVAPVAAGRAAGMPRWLLDRGWRLSAVSHTTGRSLTAGGLRPLTAGLLRLQRPVELLATPPP
jgi:hypothetical protein